MNIRPYLEKAVIYLRTHIWLMAWAITAFLMSFSIVNVIWQNYRIDKDLAVQQANIEKLEAENGDLENLIAYLKTDSFKEKEARRKLNYQKAGEKVLLIPRSEADDLKLDIDPQEEETAKPVRQLFANWGAWWEFLFK